MINLFTGYDRREAIGWHVFVQSVLDNTNEHVAIHRLGAQGMPQGSNAFTTSRFIVPEMMKYRGRAIFADASDMLCLADIAELDAMFDPRYAVQVVKHAYMTRNPVKYIGTEMECENLDYPCKNWASLMLINCAHPAWMTISEHSTPMFMLQFLFLRSHEIGDLPMQWNRLVDEGQPTSDAKIMHWTAGIPAFAHYRDAPGAQRWFDCLKTVTGTGVC